MRWLLSDGTYTESVNKIAEDIQLLGDRHLKRVDAMERLIDRGYAEAMAGALRRRGFTVMNEDEAYEVFGDQL